MRQDEEDAEMTPTTDTVRDRDFCTLECDIPAELTIHQYRQTRAQRDAAGRRVSRLPRLLRRRARRRDAAA